MFDQMFKDERAVGYCGNYCMQCCGPAAVASCIDTLICGGEGFLRGVFVPIFTEFMKLVFI